MKRAHEVSIVVSWMEITGYCQGFRENVADEFRLKKCLVVLRQSCVNVNGTGEWGIILHIPLGLSLVSGRIRRTAGLDFLLEEMESGS